MSSRTAFADEEALARALMDRRPEAVTPAWELLLPYVDRTLQRLLGRERDREDLIQEVFLRFFRTVPKLRDPEALRPFVFGIAARVVKREVRRRWLTRWLVARDTETLEQAAAPRAGARDPLAAEALVRLEELLGRLSAEDRSLFVARFVEEMELADVARAHGMSFSTTRRRLDRAWARVQRRAASDPILGSYLEDHAERGAP